MPVFIEENLYSREPGTSEFYKKSGQGRMLQRAANKGGIKIIKVIQ